MGLVGRTAGYEEPGRLVAGRHASKSNDKVRRATTLLGRHSITLTVLGASLVGTFLAWLAARVAVDPVGLGAGRLTVGQSAAPVSYPTVVVLGGLCISGMLAVIALLADRRRRELEREISTMARHLEKRAAPVRSLDSAGPRDRYALAVQAAQDGLWDWNLRTDCIDYSPRWKALIGFGETDLSDRPREWLDRVHPEDRERLRIALDEHLSGTSAYFKLEHRLLHRDGSYRLMLSRGVAIRDESGRATRVAGSQTDVTAQRRVEERLVHAAMHDTLTGLPNRKLFMEKLTVVGKLAAQQEGYRYALLFLDVDRFKLINDSLGPAAGDELLVEVSRRLRRAVRPGDAIARLGGDEFAVLLDDIRDETEATKIAGNIQAEMVAPFELSGRQVFTGVSIGITFNANPDQETEDLVRNADTAMSRAKEHGQAGYKLFDQGMHERAVERLRVETELRHALDRNEFLIYYQPVMDMASGKITGCEALLRWGHPERGLVLPNEFIPVAEETGLICACERVAARQGVPRDGEF